MTARSAIITSSTTPSKLSRVEQFLQKHDPPRARLILLADATESRERMWKLSTSLTDEMFNAVATIGGLDLQLCYYRGYGEWFAAEYVSDARQLAGIMRTVECRQGPTQIARGLQHGASEYSKKPIAALCLISDACEETPSALYAAAHKFVKVQNPTTKSPVFLFQELNQESDPDRVAGIYSEIARITGGAVAQFDASSAAKFADLLKGVFGYAAGGPTAMLAQNTEAARLLLTQIKK